MFGPSNFGKLMWHVACDYDPVHQSVFGIVKKCVVQAQAIVPDGQIIDAPFVPVLKFWRPQMIK